MEHTSSSKLLTRKGKLDLMGKAGEAIRRSYISYFYGNQEMEKGPPLIYIDQLMKDTQLKNEELETAMEDRNVWKRPVVNARLYLIK